MRCPILITTESLGMFLEKNADTVIKVTSKLKEITDNVTIRDPDGNILVSPENDRNL